MLMLVVETVVLRVNVTLLAISLSALLKSWLGIALRMVYPKSSAEVRPGASVRGARRAS